MKLSLAQREACEAVLRELQNYPTSARPPLSQSIVVRAKGGEGLTTCLSYIIQSLEDRYLHIVPDFLSSNCVFHELFYLALGLKPGVKSSLDQPPSFLVDFIRLRKIRTVILEDAHCFHEGDPCLEAKLTKDFRCVMRMLPNIDFIICEAYPNITDWGVHTPSTHAYKEIILRPFADLAEYLNFIRELVDLAAYARLPACQIDERYAASLLNRTAGNLDLTVRYLTTRHYNFE